MDRIQPPPNYYGAPYPQGVEVSHPNFAPPPNLQSPSYSSKERRDTMQPPTENDTTNGDTNEYFTKFLDGHIGQKVKVYCSFSDSAQWHDMIFEGLLWGAGDDNIIIYDEKKDIHTLILAVYILYIEFSDIEPKTYNGNNNNRP